MYNFYNKVHTSYFKFTQSLLFIYLMWNCNTPRNVQFLYTQSRFRNNFLSTCSIYDMYHIFQLVTEITVIFYYNILSIF